MPRHLSLLIVLTAGLATACKPVPEAEPVTLTFWHTFNAAETTVVNERVEQFEHTHPDIKVQVNVLPYGSAQSRVREAFHAGTAPDLFRMETAWTPEFVELGIVAPADEWMTDEERSDLLDQASQLFEVNGRLWGAPQVVDCLALLYNRDLLRDAGLQPPTTFAELQEVGARLTDHEAGHHGFYVRGDAYWFLPFLWGHGADLMDEEGHIVVDQPAAVRALEEYTAMSRTTMAPKRTDWAMEYRRMMRVFREGRTAMILNGPWSTAEVLGGEAFTDPSNLGIAPIPGGPEGFATPIGGHAYAINAHSAHKQEAAQLAEFLFNVDSQVSFVTHANVLPTRKSAYTHEEVASNRIVQEYRKVLETGHLRPVVPEMAYVLATFSSAVQSTLDDELEADAAMEAVGRQWRERREAQKPEESGAP